MMKPFVNNVVQIITYITGLVIKFKQIIVKFHLKETLLMQAIQNRGIFMEVFLVKFVLKNNIIKLRLIQN